MYYSAFQQNAFQNTAFQIRKSNTVNFITSKGYSDYHKKLRKLARIADKRESEKYISRLDNVIKISKDIGSPMPESVRIVNAHKNNQKIQIDFYKISEEISKSLLLIDFLLKQRLIDQQNQEEEEFILLMSI